MPRPKPRTPAKTAFQQGVEAYQKGQYVKAQQYFEQVLYEDPANLDTYNNLGLTFLQLGKTKDAEKTFRKGLALNPRHTVFYDNLSRLLVLQERYGEALKLLEDGKGYIQNPEFDYKILTLRRSLFGQNLGSHD